MHPIKGGVWGEFHLTERVVEDGLFQTKEDEGRGKGRAVCTQGSSGGSSVSIGGGGHIATQESFFDL